MTKLTASFHIHLKIAGIRVETLRWNAYHYRLFTGLDTALPASRVMRMTGAIPGNWLTKTPEIDLNARSY
jgi:hypothetical protein